MPLRGADGEWSEAFFLATDKKKTFFHKSKDDARRSDMTLRFGQVSRVK